MKDLIIDIIRDYRSIRDFRTWDNFTLFKNREYCFLTSIWDEGEYCEFSIGNTTLLKNCVIILEDTPLNTLEKVITALLDITPKNSDKEGRYKLTLYSEFSNPKYECRPISFGNKLNVAFEVGDIEVFFLYDTEPILADYSGSEIYKLKKFLTVEEILHQAKRRFSR